MSPEFTDRPNGEPERLSPDMLIRAVTEEIQDRYAGERRTPQDVDVEQTDAELAEVLRELHKTLADEHESGQAQDEAIAALQAKIEELKRADLAARADRNEKRTPPSV